ncbi:MAG: acetyl-CoA hydrolase/transferase family protein [Candidatus Hodarchaeales archaeon]|jgi:acetyl-CoA hydrolase
MTAMTKITTAEEALKVIESNQRIFITGNASTPFPLLDALAERARNKEFENVEALQVLAFGGAPHAEPGLAKQIRVNALFMGHNIRAAVQRGEADYTPIFLGEIPKLFKTQRRPDVALIHVSPPDEHGFCSFGCEVGISKPAAQVAKVVIAEVNEQMPRTLGDSFIHTSRINHMVVTNRPLPEVTQGTPSKLHEQIAEHISTLIKDGSTLQMGIGGIADAVLKFLKDKRDLGIHTELFADGIVDLVNEGVITNEMKTFHPGKIIAGFLFGTKNLYRFVHNNPLIELHPTDYVNDPFLIARNDNMVSINSAIEVDLTGQVAADSIGQKFYSGIGGQVDFIRGAARSKGGKPIIALPSTTKNDTITRIVPTLKPGAGVVTSRGDVHYVITEYGIANLAGKPVRERVKALIGIAHPKFHDELEKYAKDNNMI